MSLRPQVCPTVPEETVRIARASFPKGSRYMRLRDELGAVFDDSRFAGLFPRRGRPAEAPWRLALVTLFQFAEGLPDRQAAEAVRGRIDWKYALALPLADPGFDSTVLSEFRSRLIKGGAEQVLLEAVLTLAQERNLLSAGGRQRTDSTHVLAAVRALNRLECVIETMRHALESLAVVAPDWLLVHAQPDWAERYGHRAMDNRLAKNAARREERARIVGQDGHALLAAALDPAAPGWLRQVPAVEILRRVWVQQFYLSAEGVQWRTAEHGIPPSVLFLSSPYDTDAHLGRKRTTQWVGYKAHLTETCDEGRPHLITHVQTTAAPVADGEATTPAHTALRDKGLLPAIHLVDTGYLDAELLVTTRRDFGIPPRRPGPSRRALAGTRRQGLRGRPLQRGLGAQGGDLSSGRPQYKLDAGPGQPRRRGDQDQVFQRRLRCVPTPGGLRAWHESAAQSDAAHARAACRTHGGTAARNNGRVCRAECGESRGGGHDITGRAGLRPTPITLCRSRQGPPSARRDCGSDEPGQDDRMARWRRFGNDKTLEVPSIDDQSCLMGIRQQYHL